MKPCCVALHTTRTTAATAGCCWLKVISGCTQYNKVMGTLKLMRDNLLLLMTSLPLDVRSWATGFQPMDHSSLPQSNSLLVSLWKTVLLCDTLDMLFFSKCPNCLINCFPNLRTQIFLNYSSPGPWGAPHPSQVLEVVVPEHLGARVYETPV